MEQTNKPQFVIDDDPIVDWPVIVKLPSSGGRFTEYEFSVSMRVLSPKEYEDIFDKTKAPSDPSSSKLSEIIEMDVPLFQRLIIGWSGVTDRDGNEVEYSPEKLAEQVTGPRGLPLQAGLMRAISEIRYGARLGN